ncbi:hypothetical protein HOY80DRAFT_948059 [Tuber brumale]|nr:hypothetical protein HOY80DRAFT_948059 [Tuber brumale]
MRLLQSSKHLRYSTGLRQLCSFLICLALHLLAPTQRIMPCTLQLEEYNQGCTLIFCIIRLAYGDHTVITVCVFRYKMV